MSEATSRTAQRLAVGPSEDVSYIVRIKSPEDMFGRMQFVRDVNAKEVQPKRIIGKYDFSQEILCGLTCREGHKHGLFVLLTNSKETNIGLNCGAKYFGSELMRDLRNRFAADSDRRTQLDMLREIVALIPSFEARLLSLRSGALWAAAVYESARTALPSDLFYDLCRRALAGNDRVDHVRSLTAAEIEANRTRGVKAERYKAERIGRIAGLGLFDGDAVRAYRQLEREIEELKYLSDKVLSLSGADARRWTAWRGEFAGRVERAERVIVAAKQFATPETLALLGQIEPGRGGRAANLTGCRWDTKTGELKTPPRKLHPPFGRS